VKLGKVEKWSFGYMLLKSWVGFWHNNFFYRKIVVLNKENIPKGAHIIFTLNHQNSLMDPLALHFALKWKQLVFLARSDIFKKKFIAKILLFLKILPIYRIRDGYSALKNNDAVFLKTIEVVKNKRALALLPEGSHEGIHRLRQLKKGFARIAFQTEEANDYSLDIKIVPVGLDYDNYNSYRSKLVLNFGEAISVSDYYEMYKESPVKTINRLKDDLWEKLHPLMIHIESEEFYDLNNELRIVYRKKMLQHMAKNNGSQCLLKADQELIKILGVCEREDKARLQVLKEKLPVFLKDLKASGVSQATIEKDRICIMQTAGMIVVLAITFPLFLYGLINNFLPYWLPKKIAYKIRDPQFISSIKFVLSRIFFPLFHIIQAVLLGIFSGSWLAAG